MIFRNKLEELISPFKYIENTIGCIVVKSDDEVNEIIDTLSKCTQEINDNEIKLINGSIITIIKSKSEVVRGKRAICLHENYGIK